MLQHRLVMLLVTLIALALPDPGAARAQSTVTITGSRPMKPLLQALADAYVGRQGDSTIKVEGGDSQGCIKALVDGKAQVASLARPATEEEHRRVRLSTGKDLIAVPIAMDGVAVFVHPTNPLTYLTLEQVERILTGKVRLWDEVGVELDPPIVGRHPNDGAANHLKEARIRLHLPPARSCSPYVLETRVLSGRRITAGREEHDIGRDVVHAVAVDHYGIGIGSAAYLSGVHPVAIRRNEDAPPIMPTQPDIRSREYPFAHYLYLCFVGQPTGPAKDFLTFAVSAEGQEVIHRSGMGLATLPEAEPSGR